MCNITSATFCWENKYQSSNQIQAEDRRGGTSHITAGRAVGPRKQEVPGERTDFITSTFGKYRPSQSCLQTQQFTSLLHVT